MLEVASSTNTVDSNLLPSAQFNVGRAYYMVCVIAPTISMLIPSNDLHRAMVYNSLTARRRNGGPLLVTMVMIPVLCELRIHSACSTHDRRPLTPTKYE